MITNIVHRLLNPIKKSFYVQQERNKFKKSLRPTDVFIVGHPKSGNTWLTLMLAVLMQKNFDSKVTLANVGNIIPFIHANDNAIINYDRFPDPRMFRNESPVFAEYYPKTVYIVRDPRSVYVSYYHHCLHDTQEHDWTIEAFVEEMINYGCIKRLEPFLIRWDKQVSQWVERSKSQLVKIVKYEDMKKDRGKILKDVVDFVGISATSEEIDLAVKRGSFDSMRKEEITFGAEPYSGDKGEKGFYVRQGKVNGWKDELPQNLAKYIETNFSETMKMFGYL